MAQDDPLSAIDWLGTDLLPRQTARPLPAPVNPADEPPVADSALAPQVDAQPLDAPNPAAAGLLPPAATGLPVTLWQGSDAARLSDLVQATDLAVPAMTGLMTMLLLAEADPPSGPGNGVPFLAARLDRLLDLGAVDQAGALLDRAGPRQAVLFDRWAQIGLLTGDGVPACQALAAEPRLSADTALRVYCTARDGDWTRAALILQTMGALGDMPPRTATLLALFLDPELADDIAAPPPPARPSPLEYRLYEALGEPLPTAALPRAFAVLDLAGNNGWKAQIEAAERLARAGTLPANRLLGLYTLRQPAASGGLWDRVAAFQAFEAALDSDAAGTRSRALEQLWPQMRSAGLLVPVAALFADRIAGLEFEGRAALMARYALLLSPEYEALGARDDDTDPRLRFLSDIARGAAPGVIPDLPHADPVAAAFSGAPMPETLQSQLTQGRLGEVILRAMALFASGAEGNTEDLTDALATLRRVGLEDAARRAALQLVILDAERARR
ncbi:hypothetical protein KUH32_13755 [Thalassococcus sp. CAU 1522]|uniref:Antifreeze glycopeptide polyprotein n=1 Tax=Thalassococcus arenae TaxID=2851652 RepID=A0ABS6NAX6_9RHOB|nr:hypothetical protein [Thalassococcus arenae]